MPRRAHRTTWLTAVGPIALLLAGCPDGQDVPRPTAASSVGPIELGAGQTVGGPARALGLDDGPRFSGVAAINVAGGTCSGSFVVPAALDLERDGPAYLLTAGHCVLGADGAPNDIAPDAALVPRADGVRFRLFGDSRGAATIVEAKRAVFATLKGVDLAIVELEPTRHELRRAGVVPFVLSASPTADGDVIAFAGHPQQILGPDAPAVLGACRQLRRAPLVLEAQFHFWDVLVNECQGSGPGASGSPVFALATGAVVAVLNTGVEPGQDIVPCAINQPCETRPAIASFAGTTYAIPVHGLGACFDAEGRFAPATAVCPLDRDVQMQPARQLAVGVPNPGNTIPFMEPLAARGLTHYRTLVGAATTVDCRDPAAYLPPVSWSDAPWIMTNVPGDAGEYLLCVLAGPGADTSAGWQDPRTPTVLRISVH